MGYSKGIIWTYESICIFIKEKYNCIVVKVDIKNGRKYVTFYDNFGYYYISDIQLLKTNMNTKFVYANNPYSVQNIKLWCKLNNKPFELISNKFEGTDKKLKWKCLKEGCLEEFNMSWSCIINQEYNCPFCAGVKVGLSNCLATKNPNIAKEWHPTKNGDLTPYDVTCGSHKEVWWQCSVDSKHEWNISVKHRNINGCPYCSGFYPSENYNLLLNNPKLCEEWDYEKNIKSPKEYTPGSNQYAWWICKECGNEWEATIGNRNGICKSGCPECNKSKGEKKCKEVFIGKGFIEITQYDYDKLLDKNDNTYYIPQKTFDGLVGINNGLLSYDFYLPQYNLLIEYQGEFHDGTAHQQSKEELIIQVEHDRRKRECALKNNIKLLEIWYWEKDNIEEILRSELKRLEYIENI